MCRLPPPSAQRPRRVGRSPRRAPSPRRLRPACDTWAWARGCSLRRTGLQPRTHGVAASDARGCSLGRMGLQPLACLPESMASTLLALSARVAPAAASVELCSVGRICLAGGSPPPAPPAPPAAAAEAASPRLPHARFFSSRSCAAVGHASAKASSAVLAAPKSAASGRSGLSPRQSGRGRPSLGRSALCTMAW